MSWGVVMQANPHPQSWPCLMVSRHSEEVLLVTYSYTSCHSSSPQWMIKLIYTSFVCFEWNLLSGYCQINCRRTTIAFEWFRTGKLCLSKVLMLYLCNSVLYTIHWVSMMEAWLLIIVSFQPLWVRIKQWTRRRVERVKGESEYGEKKGNRERNIYRSYEMMHIVFLFFLTLVPTAPQNVTLSNINQRSIMVAWEAPAMPNGILGPYNVCTLSWPLWFGANNNSHGSHNITYQLPRYQYQLTISTLTISTLTISTHNINSHNILCILPTGVLHWYQELQ